MRGRVVGMASKANIRRGRMGRREKAKKNRRGMGTAMGGRKQSKEPMREGSKPLTWNRRAQMKLMTTRKCSESMPMNRRTCGGWRMRR